MVPDSVTMGTYRVEFTFEIGDEDLSDLAMLLATKHAPDFLTDDQRMGLVTSALSLDGRDKALNLASHGLSLLLGDWTNCPIRQVSPGLQVTDLDNPDLPPIPYPETPELPPTE